MTEGTATVPDVDNGQLLCKVLYYTNLLAGVKSSVTARGFDGSNSLFSRKNDTAAVRISFVSENYISDTDSTYAIRLLDRPVPVDEYTPLLLAKSMVMDPFFSCENFKKLERPLVLVHDIRKKPDLEIPSLEISKYITYDQLKNYDTFICEFSNETWRISSLLMQFSSKPKHWISYKGNVLYGLRCNLPFPAKKRCEYVSFTPTHFWFQRFFFRPIANATLAEACVSLVGYNCIDEIQTQAWLSSIIGETKAKDFWNTNKSFSGSIRLDPLADWTSILEEVDVNPSQPRKKSSKRQNTRSLRKKLEYSLTRTRGTKNTDSLTIDELKLKCGEYGLSSTGTRRDLIQRLLDNI
jgi:hypothetical protein